MKQLRVVATANTMADLPLELRQRGSNRLTTAGFSVSFPENADKKLYHLAGSVEERVEDFHQALKDPNVYGILSVFGGYNTNQMLDRIDFDLLKSSGKPLIGYSDFTALLIAAATKKCCPVFHGPSFASFCDPNFFEYSLKNFQAVLAGETITFQSPRFFADDLWYLKEGYGPRDVKEMGNWRVLREGESRGPIWGGNLETLTRLAGTEYMPDFKNAILFIEDMTGNNLGTFHRDMTHLRHLGVFDVISGLIVGKFPGNSKLDNYETLQYVLADVLKNKPSYPILSDVLCSHVDPMMTIPIGRMASLLASNSPAIVVNA